MWHVTRRLVLRNGIFGREIFNKNVTSNLIWKSYFARQIQDESNDDSLKVSKLFQPGVVKSTSSSLEAQELVGKIKKTQILKVLNQFSKRPEIRDLCTEHGLEGIHFKSQTANDQMICR